MDSITLPGPSAFHNPQESLRELDSGVTARILAASSDVTLVLDRGGIIRDVAVGSADLGQTPFSEWLNRPWAETVAADSQGKVAEMLHDAGHGAAPRWRQVNHDSAAGQLPVRYLAMDTGKDGRVIAVGRDMRAAAALQHRLLQAQQSMERDYIRLRQTESRYRLLFDVSSEPVVIVDTASRKVTTANPAALAITGHAAGESALGGQPFAALIEPEDRDAALAMMGAVAKAEQSDPVRLRLAHGGRECFVSATLFRQDRGAHFLIRLVPVESSKPAQSDDHRLLDVVERMPDAFVLADGNLGILLKNAAFLDLTHHARREDVRGAPLSSFLGRPGIDFNLLVSQLREHGSVRNFQTVLRDRNGVEEEVEVSAVAVPVQGDTSFGFSIRPVARRLAAEPEAARAVPRSVEQLTELVGRVSLKEIVRESTDLIERLCIEAALTFTANNRASAAEILGLSRQSLYSKLHRHGMGNLATDGASEDD
jgi:transcriptional regulator PpsR